MNINLKIEKRGECGTCESWNHLIMHIALELSSMQLEISRIRGNVIRCKVHPDR